MARTLGCGWIMIIRLPIAGIVGERNRGWKIGTVAFGIRLRIEVDRTSSSFAKSDPKLARLCFAKIEELGDAMNRPEVLKIVLLAARANKKIATAEIAKVGK